MWLREREREKEQLSHLGDASILAALLQPVPLSQPDLHSINCQPGDFYINCSARNKLPCTQEMKPLPRIYHLSTVFLRVQKTSHSESHLNDTRCTNLCLCNYAYVSYEKTRAEDRRPLSPTHTPTFTLTRQKQNTFSGHCQQYATTGNNWLSSTTQ